MDILRTGGHRGQGIVCICMCLGLFPSFQWLHFGYVRGVPTGFMVHEYNVWRHGFWRNYHNIFRNVFFFWRGKVGQSGYHLYGYILYIYILLWKHKHNVCLYFLFVLFISLYISHFLLATILSLDTIFRFFVVCICLQGRGREGEGMKSPVLM